MMSNSKSTQVILFLSVCFMLLFTACESNLDRERKENTQDLTSSSEQLSHFDSTNSVKRVEKTFYESGKLNQVAYFINDQLQGYVWSFDPAGRLVRKSRYGWTKSVKNSLVENIVYDSIGSINYKKSFFLSTIPASVNDTIYFSSKKSDKLNLKVKFYDPNLISYKVVVEHSGNSDTLTSFQDEWQTYTFSNLEEGIINIYFDIEVNKSDSLISVHESKRVLKTSN